MREPTSRLLCFVSEALRNEGGNTVQSPRRQVEGFQNLSGQGLGGKATSIIAIRVTHLDSEKGGKPSSVS